MSHQFRHKRKTGFLLQIHLPGRFYIAQARVMFVSKVHRIKYENNVRPIFYLDKSWISQNHSPNFICHHSTAGDSLKCLLEREEE